MARSFLGTIIKEMEKAENRKIREELKIERQLEREMEKAEKIRIREEAKMEKEEYILDRINEAKEMTDDLLESYDEFSTLIENQLSSKEIFCWDSLKDKYNENIFEFLEEEPIKKNINKTPSLLNVPKEFFLERIFTFLKRRRLNIIKQNEKHIEEIRIENEKLSEIAENEYQKELYEYKIRKNEAEIKWNKEQEKIKKSIEKQNFEIEEWKNAYLLGVEEAITSYISLLFSTYEYDMDTVVEREIGYNNNNKKLVIDLHMYDKYEIFEAEGYKYTKKTDEIEPIKMKATSINERMRNLMIQVCIATIHMIFRNDTEKHLKIITVNVFHEEICCVSAEVENDIFEKHNFTTRSGMASFLELQMHICKQIKTGVKPFEYINSEL